MLVISDATPLNVLIRLGLVDLLHDLYGAVVIPPAVAGELSHPNTPKEIRAWIASPPAWLSVKAPAHVDPTIATGAGEREAICLALELHADFLLVDDKEARGVARRLKLPITGTVGVLELAAVTGRIELRPTLDRLRYVDFFIDETVLRDAFERDTQRRGA